MSLKWNAAWRFVAVLALVCALLAPVGLAMAAGEFVIKISGSTTVFPVVQQSESAFETAFPMTDIQVTSSGSGPGITDAINGVSAIGMSSRALSSSELTSLHDWHIAKDAICMIVKNDAAHASINNISKAQVKQIWEAGDNINNLKWSDLNSAWPAQPVKPISREIGSGTRQSFLELIPVSSALEIATADKMLSFYGIDRPFGSSGVVAAVKVEPYRIGYVGIGYINDPGLKVLTVDGVACNETNVLNGSYPIGRSLHLVTRKSDANTRGYAHEYINWMRSPQGQAFVQSSGFIPNPGLLQIPAWDVNLDGACNLFDLIQITDGDWQTTNPHGYGTPKGGWIREDINKDGAVNLFDLIVATGSPWQTTWAYPGN